MSIENDTASPFINSSINVCMHLCFAGLLHVFATYPEVADLWVSRQTRIVYYYEGWTSAGKADKSNSIHKQRKSLSTLLPSPPVHEIGLTFDKYKSLTIEATLMLQSRFLFLRPLNLGYMFIDIHSYILEGFGLIRWNYALFPPPQPTITQNTSLFYSNVL